MNRTAIDRAAAARNGGRKKWKGTHLRVDLEQISFTLKNRSLAPLPSACLPPLIPVRARRRRESERCPQYWRGPPRQEVVHVMDSSSRCRSMSLMSEGLDVRYDVFYEMAVLT